MDTSTASSQGTHLSLFLCSIRGESKVRHGWILGQTIVRICSNDVNLLHRRHDRLRLAT